MVARFVRAGRKVYIMRRKMLATMCLAVLCAAGLAYGGDWSDNFDSYDNGSKMCGQGGWECWFNDPVDALVTDAQANSKPHSVECIGASDLVYPHLGADSGQWTLSTMHYIPTGNNASTYLIVNNEYDANARTAQWAIEIQFTTGGKVLDDFRGENDINTIYDKWVPIRIEIDLDADTQETYYNEELLSEGVWAVRFGAVEVVNLDLFSNGPQEFFDDISFTEVTGGENCDGRNPARVNAKCKSGGKKVIAKLKKAAPNTDVTFEIDGGDLIEKTTNNRGKAKGKFKRQARGNHTVTVCDLEAKCSP